MLPMKFRDALRSGKTVYGTLVTSSAPRMFDTVISLRPDFVFLCTEHIFYNPDTLGWMCRAYKAAGINPVVRILKPDPYLATQALDSGAGTVLAPYVEDVDQVLELIGAVKFRPLKGKKLKSILLGKEKPDEKLEGYLRDHNQGSVQLQLEWARAGANIIMHSSDVFLFADKYQEDMNRIRASIGENEIETQKGESV